MWVPKINRLGIKRPILCPVAASRTGGMPFCPLEMVTRKHTSPHTSRLPLQIIAEDGVRGRPSWILWGQRGCTWPPWPLQGFLKAKKNHFWFFALRRPSGDRLPPLLEKNRGGQPSEQSGTGRCNQGQGDSPLTPPGMPVPWTSNPEGCNRGNDPDAMEPSICIFPHTWLTDLKKMALVLCIHSVHIIRNHKYHNPSFLLFIKQNEGKK